MSDLGPVRQALDELIRIQSDLAAVANRADEARRGDLVRLRRLLATHIAVVRESAEPLFAHTPEKHADFRRLYSAMRSAAALHQAEWPAIRLSEADDEYLLSARRVRAANAAFVEWLRAQLAVMPTRR